MANKGYYHWECKRSRADRPEARTDIGTSRTGRAMHTRIVDGCWGHSACYPGIPCGGIVSPTGFAWRAGYLLPLVPKTGAHGRQ
jgi:hypothetical protein